MGYSHYWKCHNLTETDCAGYLEALPTLKDIVKRHRKLLCYEYDEPKKAPVVDETKIFFNGKGDAGHETFVFQPDSREDFAFCKTASKPYDLPVCEILLVLKAYMPNLGIGSDGFSGRLPEKGSPAELDGDWQEAIRNVGELYNIMYDVEITEERAPYCRMGLVLRSRPSKAA